MSELDSFLISLNQVPYLPSSAQQVANTMSLLKGRSGKMVDLGSGDGRLVREEKFLLWGSQSCQL